MPDLRPWARLEDGVEPDATGTERRAALHDLWLVWIGAVPQMSGFGNHQVSSVGLQGRLDRDEVPEHLAPFILPQTTDGDALSRVQGRGEGDLSDLSRLAGGALQEMFRNRKKEPMSAIPIKIPGVRFEHLIGTGGMSEVWLGYHGGLDKEVAIKVMFKEAAASGEDVRQFMLEGRVMANINHPGIVQSYEADCRDGRYYFIMDYVNGYTFALLLARQERIPEADVLVVLDSVAEALDYAWREHGVIHCDLKPDNLMVGGDGLVKIMDLGLCHILGAGGGGSAFKGADGKPKETITGTPAYMSPEQIYGDKEMDPRSDIYSMGATLYQLVTGRILFPLLSNDDTLRAHVDEASAAPDPRMYVPTISAGFVRLLSKMCVKNKAYRYSSWRTVLADSRIVQAGGIPEPLPEGISSSIKENGNEG